MNTTTAPTAARPTPAPTAAPTAAPAKTARPTAAPAVAPTAVPATAPTAAPTAAPRRPASHPPAAVHAPREPTHEPAHEPAPREPAHSGMRPRLPSDARAGAREAPPLALACCTVPLTVMQDLTDTHIRHVYPPIPVRGRFCDGEWHTLRAELAALPNLDVTFASAGASTAANDAQVATPSGGMTTGPPAHKILPPPLPDNAAPGVAVGGMKVVAAAAAVALLAL